MAHDFGGGAEGRQDIDKTEQLGFEGGVLHGPIHQASVGSFFGKKSRRGLLFHQLEELLALG